MIDIETSRLVLRLVPLTGLAALGVFDDTLRPAMLDRVSFVNGYKLERNDPWHRIWIGNAYNAFAKALFTLG